MKCLLSCVQRGTKSQKIYVAKYLPVVVVAGSSFLILNHHDVLQMKRRRLIPYRHDSTISSTSTSRRGRAVAWHGTQGLICILGVNNRMQKEVPSFRSR